MKDTLIVVLLVVVIILAATLWWSQCLAASPSANSRPKVLIPFESRKSSSIEAPVAPKSETSVSAVDQKLETLGFAPSANVHRITVQ
jgi:hypothetical protein